MALIDDFKAKFPNDFTEQQVDDNWANLDPEYLCFYRANLNIACEKSAALYVIAHLLYLSLQTSKASFRLATSTTVHDVSVSYATPANIDDLHTFYNTTRYGQLFLMITSSKIGPMFA